MSDEHREDRVVTPKLDGTVIVAILLIAAGFLLLALVLLGS